MRAADSFHCGCAREASVYEVQDPNGTSQTHVWCSDCFHGKVRYELKGKTVTLTEKSAPRTLVIYAKTAVVTKDMHPVRVVVTRFAAEGDHPRWTVSKLRRGKVASSKLFATQQDALDEAAYIVDHLKLYRQHDKVAQSLIDDFVACRQAVIDAEKNVERRRSTLEQNAKERLLWEEDFAKGRRKQTEDWNVARLSREAAHDAQKLVEAEQQLEAAKDAHERACVAVFE